MYTDLAHLDFLSEHPGSYAATKRSMETLKTSGGASACLTVVWVSK